MRTSISCSCHVAPRARASSAVRADAPHVYAITKARASSPPPAPPIRLGHDRHPQRPDRGGRAPSVTPPADAYVIDGAGHDGLSGPDRHGPAGATRRAGGARAAHVPDAARSSIAGGGRTSCAPSVVAAGYCQGGHAGADEGSPSAGITTVLAMPAGESIRGQSALVNVLAAGRRAADRRHRRRPAAGAQRRAHAGGAARHVFRTGRSSCARIPSR